MKSFDTSNDYKALEELGLSRAEALIYLSVLDLGQATISEIAGNAGIERTRVYYHIDTLKRLNLLSEVERGKRTLYLPADPKVLKQMLEHKKIMLDSLFPKIDRQYSLATSRSITEYYNGAENVQRFYARHYELIAEMEPPNNTLYILGTSFQKVTSASPAFMDFQVPKEQLNVISKCILPLSSKSKNPSDNLNDPYIIKRFNLPPAEIKYIADKYAYPGAVMIINDVICLIDYKNFNYSIIENANVAKTWMMFFSFIWDNLK